MSERKLSLGEIAVLADQDFPKAQVEARKHGIYAESPQQLDQDIAAEIAKKIRTTIQGRPRKLPPARSS